MSEQCYNLDSQAIGQLRWGGLTGLTIARRVFQGVGGGACIALAAALPWTEIDPSGMTVGALRLPAALLVVTALATGGALIFFAASVWGLVRRLPAPTRWSVFAIALATALSVAGWEYGYRRAGGLSPYEYRGAVRLVLYALGILLMACAVPEDVGPRFSGVIRRSRLGWKHVLALAGMATAIGALVGAVVLDGMPHVIDGTTYLLQGRMLWSGDLTTPTPQHVTLFEKELLAFRTSDAGYYGKYPAGWPGVLGLFDALGAAWLAAPLLAGALVVLTYLTVAERASRRTAGLAAVCAACCPWLWMNAGTMMSHLASAVWLWLFLWLMIRGVRLRSRGLLVLSGLALGAAVLTRPADAAFFALPAIAAALGWMTRRPKLWLTRLPLIALATLPGIAIYFWINNQVTGAAGGSSYGDDHVSMLLYKLPESVGHALIWLHESWVGLSSQWFAGAVPAGLAMACGVVFGARFLKGQTLVLVCSASLLVCYTFFVFGGRAWVGPRWYVPLIPAGALLIAAGVEAAACAARMRSPGGVLAAGYLRASLVAIAVMMLVVLPTRIVELLDSPPHGIDAGVVATVERAGLHNAVVALPASGLDPVTGQPNYKRGIAGMWAMDVPFEDSAVIYIAAVQGWQPMAEASWPERKLYMMSEQTGDWTLYRVDPTPVTP